MPNEKDYYEPELTRTVFKSSLSEIPESFDVRSAWPECASVTGHIRDQSSCGSCWAFASTESFNDRYCISHKGKFNNLLSTEDTVSCCNGLQCAFSQGCNGGQPSGNYF